MAKIDKDKGNITNNIMTSFLFFIQPALSQLLQNIRFEFNI